MKKKKNIIGAIIVFLLVLSVFCGSVSLSYFSDKEELETANIATEFLNTKINARIDDTIETVSSDDFVVKTIDVRQYNNGNVIVQSGLNVNLSWENETGLENVYLYNATLDDSYIKSDVLDNGAANALNVVLQDNAISYDMDNIEIKKNTEENQKIKVVIAGKYNDKLNIVLKSDVSDLSGYGFTENLYAHLFITCGE